MGRLFLSMIVGAVIAAGIGHWNEYEFRFDFGGLTGWIQAPTASSGTTLVKHGK